MYTNGMSSGANVQALLEQTGWIRSLARSLASDVHLAEELAQDAWVAGLERPPAVSSTDRPLRAWLAAVIRNRWSELGRERARREERERLAARREALPSAHDLIEKASIQQQLVEAVLELDEPYRTTVLLRFFEDLPQREIARRMLTSPATVNSRLARALEKLRARLSRGNGRSAWLQVLLPLLHKPAAPVAVLGVGAMKVTLSLVAAASVLVGILFWSSSAVDLASEDSPLRSASTIAPPRTEDGRSGMLQEGGAPRAPAREVEEGLSEAETELAEAVETPPHAVGARTVRGRVLDAAGIGQSGIALAVASREEEAPLESEADCKSDAGGRFEIELAGSAETIVSADPRFATVHAGSARVQSDTEAIVVIAPRIELAGTVVDKSGSPLPGALVHVELPPGFGAEWGLALDHSIPRRWTTRAVEGGRFELAAVPSLDGTILRAALGGFETHVSGAPSHTDLALHIVLARPQAENGLVRGIVLDSAGSPVQGARVSAGNEVAFTDRAGEFAIDVTREGTRPQLLAVERGLTPAVFKPEMDSSGKPIWPAYVALQLGGPPQAIHGRVIDREGRPIANAKIWLDDPTPFGRLDGLPIAAESLARGDERFWSFELTQGDGTFEIGGLLPRSYRVQAIDPRTLVSAEVGPIGPESSPVEVRLPTDEVHARVAGKVVTESGSPISGVVVRPYRVTYELEHEGGIDNDVQAGESVVTGEDGAFQFLSLSRDVNLVATGDTILSAAAFLAEERDLENIAVVASLRLHVQVELDEPKDRADSLRIFDEQGQRSILSVFRGGGSHASFESPLLDGRSAVLSVNENAAVVALYRSGAEIARIPLHLVPGTINVVRY